MSADTVEEDSLTNPQPEDQLIQSDSKDTDNASKKEPENKEKPKNIRHRRKGFFNSIQEQMEFYFSDANLSKDRFLMKLIDEDPWIPIEVFLKFNKIKKLVNNTSQIVKSLANSDLIEVNEDKTKIRRKSNIVFERDVEDKTIYVECLPPSADHEWVKKMFSRFGMIAYISLPKFKHSHKIKEFGFIEFEKSESVKKSIQYFKEFNGVLSMNHTEPSELLSIKSYIQEQKEINSKKNTLSANDENSSNKRKHSDCKDEVDEETGEPEKKKTKSEDDFQQEVSNDNDSESDESEIEKNDTVEDPNCTELLKKSDVELSGSDLKVAKKPKRRKHKKKTDPEKIANIEGAMSELRILPKKDWKSLRNKYLNLQRKKISELKRNSKFKMKSNNFRSGDENSGEPPSNKQSQQQSESNPPNVENVQLHHQAKKLKSMNFYCAADEGANDSIGSDVNLMEKSETLSQIGNETKITFGEENIVDDSSSSVMKKPSFKYEPGIILKVKFLEPCIDCKSFKEDIRQYPGVKYIDIKEGAFESYIRMDNPKHLSNLKKSISSANFICQTLTGEDELEYWKKIMKDREMKLNKCVKIKSKRGREKISGIVATHIRFEDDAE